MQKRPKLRPTLQATYYSDQSVRLSIQDYLSEEHLLSLGPICLILHQQSTFGQRVCSDLFFRSYIFSPLSSIWLKHHKKRAFGKSVFSDLEPNLKVKSEGHSKYL